MNKRILTLFLSLTLLLSLAACGGNADTTDARRDANEIVVGIAQDLENSLDPYTSVTAANREVLFNVFEGLVKPDADGNLIPAVAERWEVSDDQLTYTFHLRPGVKFHDGSEVTAMDVAWSIDKAMQSGNWKALDNIDAIDIGSDYVSVVLKAADSDFLSYMTLAITPEDHADGADPVGTGPFKFISRAAQQNLVLERFADYWGEGAKVDKVTYQIYENAEALVMALKSGAVDICAHLTATQANQLTESFDILEGTMNLVQAVYLNHAYEPLANETVRKALCYALDREQVFDVVADGHGTAVGSSIYPNFRKYFLPELADLYPHDTEKAKAMLAEAGYPNGFDMSIAVISSYQPHMDTAEVVVEQLRAIGVNAEVVPMDEATWADQVYKNRQFQPTINGLAAKNTTASDMLARFVSTNGKNFVNYNNSEYDALYAQAQACTDDAQQTAIYKQLETMLTETAANLYLQDLANLVAIRSDLTGYQFYPIYAMDFSTVAYSK